MKNMNGLPPLPSTQAPTQTPSQNPPTTQLPVMPTQSSITESNPLPESNSGGGGGVNTIIIAVIVLIILALGGYIGYLFINQSNQNQPPVPQVVNFPVSNPTTSNNPTSSALSNSTDAALEILQINERDSARISALKDINVALASYFTENAAYPQTITIKGSLVTIGTKTINLQDAAVSNGTNSSDKNGTAYCYQADSSLQTYKLGVNLESSGWGAAGSNQQLGNGSGACTTATSN